MPCWKRDVSALPAAGGAAGEVQFGALPSTKMSSQQPELTSVFFTRFSAQLQLNCESCEPLQTAAPVRTGQAQGDGLLKFFCFPCLKIIFASPPFPAIPWCFQQKIIAFLTHLVASAALPFL